MTKFAVNQTNDAKGFSITSTKVPRLGELLVAAEIIKPGVLNESLQIAKISKKLIGSTLISLGQLDEHKLQAALDIQTLIRKRLISTQLGVKALSISCSSRISANEALKSLGCKTQEKPTLHENSFVQLMIDSGLVAPQVLARAEQQSKENNLPLGRCLIVNRFTTQNKLEAVLTSQVLIRDNLITEEQAIKALKLSLARSEPLEHSLVQFGIQQLGESDKRILDLLYLAGFISEIDKLTILEISLTQEKPCYEILTESKMVLPDIVDKALTLQVQILAGHLTLKWGANLLKKSHTEGLDWQISLNEITSKDKAVNQIEQLLDLLLGANILTEQEITAINKIAKNNDRSPGDIFLEQKNIDRTHLDAAWQAQRMIDDKLISFDYACTTLRKLTNNDKDNQADAQRELQQIAQIDLSKTGILSKNWLIKITKNLFKK